MFSDPALIPPAIEGGSVDGGMLTYDQVIGTALEGGKKFHVVYSPKDTPGLITDVMVFKKEVIKAKPELVKALIQGYIEGLDYMKKNPEKAAEIIGKAIGVSAAEVKDQLSGVYNMMPGVPFLHVASVNRPRSLFRASDLASLYYGQVLSPNGGAWMG